MVVLSLVAIAPIQCHRAQRRRPAVFGLPIRALWVTRWDYKSPDDIALIMKRCQQSGFNTVLFQVRGNGTVFYPSKIEPWAKELGGRNPGFDPLATACKEAKRRNLSLHAWVNIMPGWRGDAPPANRRQLYHAHPDWFWHDAGGRRQPLGWYNSLNPCLPEVRSYLVNVLHEIVSRYPVDGLHMDYIRFPNEWHKMYAAIGRVPDYPRDRRTLALFRRDSGGATPESSPARWNVWRAEQVTQLVRDIRTMMRKTRPLAKLSAAVGAFPDESKHKHFQDSKRWIAEGLINTVYPMNYSKSISIFDRCLSQWASSRPRIPVVMGVMFDRRQPALVDRQVMQAVRTHGHFAAFAYNSLFERRGANGRPIRDEQSANRSALRKEVVPNIRRLARQDSSIIQVAGR